MKVFRPPTRYLCQRAQKRVFDSRPGLSVPLLWRNAAQLLPVLTCPGSERQRIVTRNLCYLRSTYSYCNRQTFSISSSIQHTRTMSSDDAYSSFLDQANQDTGASKASTTSKEAIIRSVDTEVPVGLQNVELHYTSEADEPFEPVSLRWNGNLMPSESTSNMISVSHLVPNIDTL